METWEYAEIAWCPFAIRLGHQPRWSGPDGHKELKGRHGVEVLNEAARDGWELVEYKTVGTDNGMWSSCLLRRPAK
jgi:hypothetical protein